MKRLIYACLFGLLATLASAQCGNQTPNLGLYTPAHNSQFWDVCLNTNFTNLDSFLSGNTNLPSNLTINGNLTVAGTVVCGGGCGGGGTLTGGGSTAQVGVWTGSASLGGYSGLTSDTSGNLTANTVTTSSLATNGSGPGFIRIGNAGTFSTLTASFPCNGTNVGGMAVVTDSSTVVWGANIAGSGSPGVDVLAFCDGSNWTVAGK